MATRENIDRRIHKVLPSGPLRIRTGVHSLEMHKRLKRAVHGIARTPEGIEVLEKVRSGHLDPVHVMILHEKGELKKLISVNTLLSARHLIAQHIEKADLAPTTRKSYYSYLDDLLRDAPDATLDELPAVLQALTEKCTEEKTRTKFDRAKALTLSYWSHNGGKYSPNWTACAAIKRPKHSGYVNKGGPRSVRDVVATVKAMEQPHGQVYWSMCLIGGNPKEYLTDGLTIEGHAVRIHGKKNVNRAIRVVPLIFADIVPPLRAEKQVRAALHKVQKDWMLKDARNTFQHWCEMAGIPEVRIQVYAGHKPKSMSQHYRRHDVSPYLAEDGKAIREYILREMTPKEPEPDVIVPASPLF